MSNQSLKSPNSQYTSNQPSLKEIPQNIEIKAVLQPEVQGKLQKTEDSFLGTDKSIFSTNQLDSICMRIQNLRRNLANSNFSMQQHQMSQDSKEQNPIQPYLGGGDNKNQCTFRHENELQQVLNQGKNQDSQYEQMLKPTVGGGILEYQESQKELGGTQEFEEFSKYKENLSPRLLSTYHKEENWEQQSMKSDKNYSIQKENFNQENTNMENLIRQKEEAIRRETEQKYQHKLAELEKRSTYLDRSLELIEDMKSKFQHFETQQSQYNDLLLKYNNLLYQFNSRKSSNEFQYKQPIRMFSGTQVTAAESEVNGYTAEAHPSNQSLNNDINAGHLSITSPTNQGAIEEYNSNQEDIFIENQKLRENNRKLNEQAEFLKARNINQSHRSRSTSKKPIGNSNHHLSPKIPSGRALKNNSTILNIRTKNQSQSGVKDKENVKSQQKTKPRLHNQRLCSAKRNQDTPKSELNHDIQDFQKETFASLHKQIDKLTKEKAKLQDHVKRLQDKANLPPMQCCCEELKEMFEQRTTSLQQISEHWKEKTQLLVGKYYKSLQIVREDQQKLKDSTIEAVEQLKEFQEKAIKEILGKQMEVQVYYEKRLKKYDQENKKLTKRIVEKRNKSVQKQRAMENNSFDGTPKYKQKKVYKRAEMLNDLDSPICSESDSGTKDEENQFMALYQFKKTSMNSNEKSSEIKNEEISEEIQVQEETKKQEKRKKKNKINPKGFKEDRVRRRRTVTFRDEVIKGKGLADIYIVQKIEYPNDEDDDYGRISCACSIF